MQDHIKAMRDKHLQEMREMMEEIESSTGQKKAHLLRHYKELQDELKEFEMLSGGNNENRSERTWNK